MSHENYLLNYWERTHVMKKISKKSIAIAAIVIAVCGIVISICCLQMPNKYRYIKRSDKLISPEGTEYLRYPYPRILWHFDEDSVLGEIELNDVQWDIYSLKNNDDYLVLEPSEIVGKNYTLLVEHYPVFVRKGVEYPTIFDADRVKSISYAKEATYEAVTESLDNPVFEGEAAVDFMKKLTEAPIDRQSIDGRKTIGNIFVTYTGAESIYFRYQILGNGERIAITDDLPGDLNNAFEISEELYNELKK